MTRLLDNLLNTPNTTKLLLLKTVFIITLSFLWYLHFSFYWQGVLMYTLFTLWHYSFCIVPGLKLISIYYEVDFYRRRDSGRTTSTKLHSVFGDNWTEGIWWKCMCAGVRLVFNAIAANSNSIWCWAHTFTYILRIDCKLPIASIVIYSVFGGIWPPSKSENTMEFWKIMQCEFVQPNQTAFLTALICSVQLSKPVPPNKHTHTPVIKSDSEFNI